MRTPGALCALQLALLVPCVAYSQAKPPPVPATQGATPAATSSSPSPATPTTQADKSQKPVSDDKDDSQRLFEPLWTNFEGGFGYINMDSINSKNLGLQNTSAAGGMFGFGLGVRLLIFTLGARARLNDLANFSFWELDGELGIHVPLKKWDPYFAFHGGYAFDGSLGQAVSSTSDVSVHGANAGLSFGADYYFLSMLSVGLDLTADFLFLTRPPADLPSDFKDLPPSKQKELKDEPIYKDSGDSVGFGVSGSLHLGVHL